MPTLILDGNEDWGLIVTVTENCTLPDCWFCTGKGEPCPRCQRLLDLAGTYGWIDEDDLLKNVKNVDDIREYLPKVRERQARRRVPKVWTPGEIEELTDSMLLDLWEDAASRRNAIDFANCDNFAQAYLFRHQGDGMTRSERVQRIMQMWMPGTKLE